MRLPTPGLLNARTLEAELQALMARAAGRSVMPEPRPEQRPAPPGVTTPKAFYAELLLVLDQYGDRRNIQVALDHSDPRAWRIEFMRAGRLLRSTDEIWDALQGRVL